MYGFPEKKDEKYFPKSLRVYIVMYILAIRKQHQNHPIMKEFIELQDLSERIAKYLNNRDLSPNTVYTIYDGPKGLTHTVGSMEYRNDDYKELLVFRTGDDVEETYEELLESVQYALGM